MITELAVERVAFTCGTCAHRWSVDHDVQRYLDGHGDEWEYFHRDNTSVPSPYTPDGAPPSEQCGAPTTARLTARRPGPHPRNPGQPRTRVPRTGIHRPERHLAPPLEVAAPTPAPQPTADPAQT
ncbi:hypothetical protein [Streptomyces sp. DH24]|uniref:hypothetical protein n=1 Tax=Streptomyces sp. DH24 TaxID=3040123 RepID=UPI002442EAF0|nr:hypothetical protein [Streptomyces sp. DH24]MDG9718501.1 hypothetical protein [Streptomyces sp. DH24]